MCVAHSRISPKARCGAYDPAHEALSVQSRRQVKQVRRLQNLHRGLLTLQTRTAATGHEPAKLRQQLVAEWDAIRKNKAFGPRFDVWLLGFEQFGHVWLQLPTPAWTADALFLARHVCDSALSAEAQVRQARFKYLVQLDCDLAGQRPGFAQLPPKPRPPIDCLPVTEVRDVTRIGEPTGQSAVYDCSCASTARYMPMWARHGLLRSW